MNHERRNVVCILSSAHSALVGRIYHKQARTLAKAGYDVRLIAQHDRSEVVDGIRIIALLRPSSRFTRVFRLTWRVFRLARRQHADVYHFHDPELLPFGVLLKWLTGAKIVYDVHEDVRLQIRSKEWLPMWSRKLLAASYVLVERICLLSVDRIILAGDSYAGDYRRDAVVVRNYPLLSYSRPRARTGDDGQKEPDRAFRVIYVGGITDSRGAVQLVEALRIVRADGHAGVTLSLVGSVPLVDLRAELNALVRQYGLQESCLMPGSVPHEEVFDLLAQSHVGVAVLHPEPHYTRSLPTKVFEYMAAGLPVIASDFPLLKATIEKCQCGLTVNPLDPVEIARAIEYLLAHPDEADRMGENGRRAVSEKLNWEKEGERLLALYEELLGETR